MNWVKTTEHGEAPGKRCRVCKVWVSIYVTDPQCDCMVPCFSLKPKEIEFEKNKRYVGSLYGQAQTVYCVSIDPPVFANSSACAFRLFAFDWIAEMAVLPKPETKTG